MRLWTLHPKYLDPQGLVALWREALLARAVLRDETLGYKNHPQLDRFRSHQEPRSAIDSYLTGIFEESLLRGYSFDRNKIVPTQDVTQMTATSGQVAFEWRHLLGKLSSRNPSIYERRQSVADPETHPLFQTIPGQIEPWERGQNTENS